MPLPRLDKDLPVPLYHQLERILIDAIRSGEWQRDQQLPTESELAEQFEVSKITVRQAMKDLADQGYIRRERGRGTFVCEREFRVGSRELTSFSEEIRRHEQQPASKVLEQAVVGADPVTAEALQIESGAPVVRLRRLRLADGEPMAIQTAHIPVDLAPGLERENLEEASLYSVLQNRYGLQAAKAEEKYSAVLTDQEVAALLGIPAVSPAFAAERVTFLADGRPYEFVQSILRGDRYSIVLELLADRATKVSLRQEAEPQEQEAMRNV